MPRNPNGEIVLSRWKGICCWGCILLWWLGWAVIGYLLGLVSPFPYAEWLGVLGASFFGVVPMLFFSHEDKKVRMAEAADKLHLLNCTKR